MFDPLEARREGWAAGRPLNADNLLSVAADKAFHSWINRFEFYTLNVDPLVLRQGSTPETAGHNALIQDARVFTAVDGRNLVLSNQALGAAVRAHFWYRECREIVLKFAVSNIEQLCEPL